MSQHRRIPLAALPLSAVLLAACFGVGPAAAAPAARPAGAGVSVPVLANADAPSPEKLFRYGRQTSKRDRAVIAEPDGFQSEAALADRQLGITIPADATVDLKRLNSEVFKVADSVQLKPGEGRQILLFALKPGVVVQTGRLKGAGKGGDRFIVDIFWPGELPAEQGTPLAKGDSPAAPAAADPAPPAATASAGDPNVVPVRVGDNAVQVKAQPEEAAKVAAETAAAATPAPAAPAPDKSVPKALQAMVPAVKPQAPTVAAAAAPQPPTPPAAAMDLPVAAAGFAPVRPPNVPELPPARVPQPAEPQIAAPAVPTPPTAPEAPQQVAMATPDPMPGRIDPKVRPTSSSLPPWPVLQLLHEGKPSPAKPVPPPAPMPVSAPATLQPAPPLSAPPPMAATSNRVQPMRQPDIVYDAGGGGRRPTRTLSANDQTIIDTLTKPGISSGTAQQILMGLRAKNQ